MRPTGLKMAFFRISIAFMKCSECRYWQKSKMYGDHCRFMGNKKPCEKTRDWRAKQKREKKKLEMYGNGVKKFRL